MQKPVSAGLFPSEPLLLALAPVAVSEPKDASYGCARLHETAVCWLWATMRFDGGLLAAEDGRKLTVLSQGQRDPGGGPDFRNAIVQFGEEPPLRGDVEVHVRASDWRRHGHDHDERYENVVLHVILYNDDNSMTAQLRDGRKAPQCTLSRFLRMDARLAHELASMTSEPDPGARPQPACKLLVSSSPEVADRLGVLLDQAGEARIVAKAHRFQEIAASSEDALEEAAYVGLMECLGYRNNVIQFAELAKRVPLRRALAARDQAPRGESAPVLQALLFGAAGFVPWARGRTGNWDRETEEYAQATASRWENLRAYCLGTPMLLSEWRFRTTRPANFPSRRIAAASHLLAGAAQDGLFGGMLGAFRRGLQDGCGVVRSLRSIEKNLTGLVDPYWDWRYTLGGKKLTRPSRVLGRSAVRAILVNALIPLFLAFARDTGDQALERALYLAFPVLPGPAPDRITRLVSAQLFGPEAGQFVRSAKRQQGLHWIYRRYCSHQTLDCRDCPIAAALAQA